MIRTILIAILLFLLHSISAFWGWIMIIPFIIMLMGQNKARKGFVGGFLAGLIVWGLMALYVYLTKGQFIGDRMADVLYVGNPWLLVLLTGVIGAMLAGIAGGLGASLRALFMKPQRRY